MISSGILLICNYHEYLSAQAEYERLQDMARVPIEQKDEDISDEIHTDITPNQIQEGQQKKKENLTSTTDTEELLMNQNRSDFPELEIDYSELKKKNEDFVAWLYVGAVGINYPVVQAKDNEYYLNHTFEKQGNASGCIFMDCGQKQDLSSYNTFLYGHNMKDFSMFGSLKRFLYDDSLVEQGPYFYLYTEEGIRRYQIYAYYMDTPESKSFWHCQNKQEYRQYMLSTIKKSANQELHKEIGTEIEAYQEADIPKSVVLVTCTGVGSNQQRMFVHGVLVDQYQSSLPKGE